MKKDIFFTFLFVMTFFSSVVFSEPLKKSSKNSINSKKEVFSFRPLLIQGKKHLSKRAKDLKIEGKSIVESEVLFIKTNFQDRIFESVEVGQ